jgi:chromate transporter
MRRRYREVALLFLKLGSIAFGGPAAHIAMMDDEVVTKRKWMSREHFLDLVGATNLIPGPNSTEMAIHCGYHHAGWIGLILAGVCFILPAASLILILAFLYREYGSVPALEPFLYGIKPAVIAIIISAIYKLGRKALKSWELGAIGLAVIAAAILGVNIIVTILAGGIVGMVWLSIKKRLVDVRLRSFYPFFLLTAAPALPHTVPLLSLFLVFLKIGAVLFGSGYVLVAYLDSELVRNLGWLTRQVLLDAIAIGQFTPGPVLTTSTFIGFQIHGIWGAAMATLGIFLPSFLFVAILNPLISKLRRSSLASAFMDAVNISAVGIMLAVSFRLGQTILVDWRAWVLASLSILVVLIWKKINSLVIVIGGALGGYLLNLIP